MSDLELDNIAEGGGPGDTDVSPLPPKQSVGESHNLLNLVMILVGIVFFARGLFDFLTWVKLVPFPAWLADIHQKLSGEEARSALSFLGPQAIISATLGFWAFISGILMFKESEIGWGMAVVILSTMALMGVSQIVTWINVPESFKLAYWPNWIVMFTTLVGGLGFIWLLIIRKRFR